MKRFVKTIALLVTCLLLLVTGVDRAIDQFVTHSSPGLFFVCDDKGTITYSYQGDVAVYDRIMHPWHAPIQVHPGLVPRA